MNGWYFQKYAHSVKKIEVKKIKTSKVLTGAQEAWQHRPAAARTVLIPRPTPNRAALPRPPIPQVTSLVNVIFSPTPNQVARPPGRQAAILLLPWFSAPPSTGRPLRNQKQSPRVYVSLPTSPPTRQPAAKNTSPFARKWPSQQRVEAEGCKKIPAAAQCSRLVTHVNTLWPLRCLSARIGRDAEGSSRYGRR